MKAFLTWLVTPSSDPIDKWLGWIAVGAVGGLFLTILFVEAHYVR